MSNVIDAEVNVKDVNPTQETQAPAQPAAETQAPAEVKKEGLLTKGVNFVKKHKTGFLMAGAAAAGAAVAIIGSKFRKNQETPALPYYPDEDEYDEDDDEYDDEDDDEYDDDESESESSETSEE